MNRREAKRLAYGFAVDAVDAARGDQEFVAYYTDELDLSDADLNRVERALFEIREQLARFAGKPSVEPPPVDPNQTALFETTEDDGE